MKPKYKKTLSKYVKWTRLDGKESNLFKPELVEYDSNGLSPDVIMYEWESCGIPIHTSCNNPELLAIYIQGKTLRDWHITEWKIGIREGLFSKWEFKEELETMGENITKVFKGL